MTNRMHSLFVLILVLVGFSMMTGCSRIENIPPQYVGRILAPNGWEDTLYTSGQVDIGKESTVGRSNTLVLIQTSALQVKEQFTAQQNNEDNEDHRVFTADKTPVTVDVRLLLTVPDLNKKGNDERMKRLFTLGNPKQKEGSDNRVLVISLNDIYKEQAQMLVRSYIRKMFQKQASFDACFINQDALNKEIYDAILGILRERDVPMDLLGAEISNMKPDPIVWQNQVKIQAATAEIQAMRIIEEYLQDNPLRQFIYSWSKVKEIAGLANEKGNNFIFMTSPSSQGVMPLPMQNPPAAVQQEKK